MSKAIDAKVCISISSSVSSDVKEWYIDFKSQIPCVSVVIKSNGANSEHIDGKPDMKMYCSDDAFMDIASGKSSPEMSFMKGSLKIKGALNVATRIRSLLELTKSLLAQ